MRAGVQQMFGDDLTAPLVVVASLLLPLFLVPTFTQIKAMLSHCLFVLRIFSVCLVHSALSPSWAAAVAPVYAFFARLAALPFAVRASPAGAPSSSSESVRAVTAPAPSAAHSFLNVVNTLFHVSALTCVIVWPSTIFLVFAALLPFATPVSADPFDENGHPLVCGWLRVSTEERRETKT